MINVSAASVVAAHRNADDCRSIDCHSAQPRIARDKLSDAFFVVPLGNFEAFDSLPEPKHRIVVLDGKFPSNDVATHKSLGHVERSRGIPRSYHRLRHGIEKPGVAPKAFVAALQPRLRSE